MPLYRSSPIVIWEHHEVNRGYSPIMMHRDWASRNQSWMITINDVPRWGITKSIVYHGRTWHAMMGNHETHCRSSPNMTCHDGASRNQSCIITNHDVPWWGITESVVDHRLTWCARMRHHEINQGSSPIMTCHDDMPWWGITKSIVDHRQTCRAMMGHHGINRGSLPKMMRNHEIHRGLSPMVTQRDVASQNQSCAITKSIIVHHQLSRNPTWMITNRHVPRCGITKSKGRSSAINSHSDGASRNQSCTVMWHHKIN